MRSRRQPLLPGFELLGIKEFGGSLLKGNPRDARPISTKRPMHLVMRSSLARGERSFLRPGRARQIEGAIKTIGKNLGVRIYRLANSGNHLHLIVLPRSRGAFRAFVRAVSGIIARITLGAERGRGRGVKFWDARPFTRLLEWGRDFKSACAYLLQNTLEATGFAPYRERASRNPRGKKKRGRARAGPGRRVASA